MALGGKTYDADSQELPDLFGLGGALSGLCGGIAMALTAACISGVRGNDIWLEAKEIAAPLFQHGATFAPGFVAEPVIIGTLVHLFLSGFFGATYSILSRRLLKLPSDMGVPIITGLIYSFVIWMLAYVIVLPIINPQLLDMYQPAFIVQHLIYGIVTGLCYQLLRPFHFTQHQ